LHYNYIITLDGSISENGLDRGHGHHTVTWYAQLSEWCAENRKRKWPRIRDVQKDHGL